jgi:hypothetical protein
MKNMVITQSLKGCSQCTSSFSEHDHLEPIGEEVCLPGTVRIRYAFYQCPSCGQIWQRREELGLGGNGRFDKIISGPW